MRHDSANPYIKNFLGVPGTLPSTGANGMMPLPSKKIHNLSGNNLDIAIHPAYDGMVVVRNNSISVDALSSHDNMNAQRTIDLSGGPNILTGAQLALLEKGSAVMSPGQDFRGLGVQLVDESSGAILTPELRGSHDRTMYEVHVEDTANATVSFDLGINRVLGAGETVKVRMELRDAGLSILSSADSSAILTTGMVGSGSVTLATTSSVKWIVIGLVATLTSPLAFNKFGVDLSGFFSYKVKGNVTALFADNQAIVESVSRGAQTLFSQLMATLSYTGLLTEGGTVYSTVENFADGHALLKSQDDISSGGTTRYRAGNVAKGAHSISAPLAASQHYYDRAPYRTFHPSWMSLYFCVRTTDLNATFRLKVSTVLAVSPTEQYFTQPKIPYLQEQLDEFSTAVSCMPLLLENPTHMKMIGKYLRKALNSTPAVARRIGDAVESVVGQVIRVKGLAGQVI